MMDIPGSPKNCHTLPYADVPISDMGRYFTYHKLKNNYLTQNG